MKCRLLLIALLISGYLGCEKFERNNPVDPNVDLTAPTNLQITQLNLTSISLSWSHSGENCSGFKIDRKIGSANWQTAYATVDKNTKNYTDIEAVPTEINNYRVYAYADENNSAYIDTSIVNNTPVPTNLTANAMDDQSIQLTWTDNCEFETGYKVERKEESGNFSEIADLSANTTHYTDNGLSIDIEYTYRVAAYTNNNQSKYSNEYRILFSEGFALVQGGTFTMGDVLGDGESDETPTHEVTLSSFYISKYEVTQEQYQSVMGNNPGYFTGNTQNPVEQVTWYNALEFCNALSTQEGLTPCYTIDGDNTTCNWDADGYRLPTEAEWEYAARSGGRDDRKWSGTNTESNLGDYAWYDPNSGNQTHPVGEKLPNDLGIYDMSGNVWEWCWDLYGEYSTSNQTNPTGQLTGSYRVFRGGSWYNYTYYCRSADRYYYDPSNSSNSVGFRILRAF